MGGRGIRDSMGGRGIRGSMGGRGIRDSMGGRDVQGRFTCKVRYGIEWYRSIA